VSTTGDGYCWGHNQRGEIGSPARPIGVGTHEPSLIDGGHTFRTVVAGWLHACGITTTGQTLCWGANHSGQLGIGTVDTTAHRSPELVSGGHNFVAIALGSRYTCALTAEGEAYCWGENAGAQLGNGTREDRSEPTAVSTGVRFVRIVASSGFANGAFVAPPTSLQGGVGHTCGLTAAGKAYCWGWNGNGELGDGSFDDKLFPSPVAGNLVFETIAVGGAYTCGMQGDRVWCWGSNVVGQLGRGNSANSATPVAVRPPFGPG
jgi:alpha-tubulin suppressor-like RCC1 family protein